MASSGTLVLQESMVAPWEPISRVLNGQVVLYNPQSHALTIRASSGRVEEGNTDTTHDDVQVGSHACPYCGRSERNDREAEVEGSFFDAEEAFEDPVHSRVSNYFQLLQIANDTSSRPSTPPPSTIVEEEDDESVDELPRQSEGAFAAEAMAHGYFKAFFREEARLGMGANGSVYLCQHLLDSNPLGHFAVKKIAVGESHDYLVGILRELIQVRLLERLHHPNIIVYHHSWLETCQFSLFGPKVPTLHILMQWAEGGSLDDFIDARLGRRSSHDPPAKEASSSRLSPAVDEDDSQSPTSSPAPNTRAARIRAFRALQRATPEERERLQREAENAAASGKKGATWTPVHLLSSEEMKSLFGDVVEGLAFLHDKQILHLDLKPGNVLLTWDDGRLVPRAMLSDFGTSRDMLSLRQRSGNTGTLEYSSPESLLPQGRVDSKTDMWALGMILHKLLFFRLPFQHSETQSNVSHGTGEAVKMDRLEQEILEYPGFKSTPSLVTAFEARRLPRAYLVLMENLLSLAPSQRPTCDRVLVALREGRLDPVDRHSATLSSVATQLVPLLRKPTPSGPNSRREFSQGDTPRPSNSKANSHEDVPRPRSPQSPGFDGWSVRVRFPRVLWTRTFKSCVLTAKVLSLAYMVPQFQTSTLVWSLLAVAVVDTWFDSLRISAGLGLAHVLVLYTM